MIRVGGLLSATVFGAIALGVAASPAQAITAPQPLAPYANCSEAKANGDCDIPASSDKYQSKLDRDQDGIGCEC